MSQVDTRGRFRGGGGRSGHGRGHGDRGGMSGRGHGRRRSDQYKRQNPYVKVQGQNISFVPEDKIYSRDEGSENEGSRTQS